MYKYLFILFLLFVTKVMAQGNPTGLETMVAGDMIYDQGLNPGSEAVDKLRMRGVEVGFFAPVDYQFDAVMMLAAHDEGGETMVELHEMFLSTSKVFPGTMIRAGQFFLGVGRLNRIHQHDWPFIKAPKVHETFFAEEGVFDAGIEGSHIFSFENPITLTLGLMSGRRWGHAHSDGPVPQIPTHYTRISFFTPINTRAGVDLGLNYIGRKDASENRYHLAGLDFTYKKREARHVAHLFQSEMWYQNLKNAIGEVTEQAGVYFFNNLAFNQHWSMGARLDMYKDFSITNALSGKKLNNISYGGMVQAGYRSSEFARFTAALSHEFYREEGLTLSRDTRFQLQLTFIIGSHPAHDF